MFLRKTIVACTLLLPCASLCLAGGIELTFETRESRKTDPLTHKMFISGQKIAMQLASSENRAATMIFRGDKDLAWTINPAEKEYMEITKKSMDELGQTVNSAMAQMKEQLANLPPEQRAMMEQMLQGQLGAAQSAPAESRAITYKKTGEKKTISGYSCAKYDVFRGKEKVREMWVAPWNDLKDLKDASPAFESMGAFFQKMLDAFKDNPFFKSMDNPYSGVMELKGFPVVTTEFRDGSPAHETTLKQISEKGIPDDVFNVPAGYKKNSFSGNPGETEE